MPLQTTTLSPLPPSTDKSHHKPNSTGFRNPWPSYSNHDASPLGLLKIRFGSSRPPFVPVPEDREALPKVLTPDFTTPLPNPDGIPTLKVTWIGHASFLLQSSALPGATRGLNFLLDPVFSERTSPVSFFGPKRYTATPCTLEELCDNVPVDVVCISHNHYDHADSSTLGYLFGRAVREGREMVVVVGLGNGRWIRPLIPSGGEGRIRVVEGDWWYRFEVRLGDEGKEASARITITPSQHASRRSPLDGDADLWCSFAVELPPFTDPPTDDARATQQTEPGSSGVKLFFSGDTGYRTTSSFPPPTPTTNTKSTSSTKSRETSTTSFHSTTQTQHPSPSSIDINHLPAQIRNFYPHNPSFTLIGTLLGPFHLSLLPIGLTKPRSFMSAVHADAWDSISMHKDLRSKRSIGMHWGTVRGGLSAYYEEVTWPGREWFDAAREEGLGFRGGWEGRLWKERDKGEQVQGAKGKWEIGLMDVGEGLVVQS
jgi:N-acyl-phosphatidylethanolamine-hydrolysing phospholipase D